MLAATGAFAATGAPGADAIDVPAPTSPEARETITPGAGPVSVAVVVPITVDPSATGLIDSETLAVLTGLGGPLTRQLEAVIGTSAAIGLDPRIVASIRVLGSSAPQEVSDWLSRIEQAPNEVFLLAYADADPAALAQAGALDVLTPMGFDYAVDPGNFGPAATPLPTSTDGATPTPTPTPAPGETGDPVDTGPAPLPTQDDLLAWTTSLDSIAWPADGEGVSDATLTSLAGTGYTGVILNSELVTRPAQAVVDVGDIDVLASDDNLSELVRRATNSGAATLSPTLIELGAALDSAAITAPGRTLLVTLDRGWWSGVIQLPTVLSAIEASSSAQLTSLAELVAGPSVAGELQARDSNSDRDALVDQLVTAERAERAYLSIAETPLVVESPRRLALLALLASGWADPAVSVAAGDWATATSGYLDESQQIRSAVQIVESTDLFLPGDNAELPISISNALPVAVTVYVTVTPLRPSLHVRDTSVAVTVEGDSTNRAKIPVQAIKNGDVTVRVTLAGSDSVAVGTPQFTKIILQAGWETAGTIVAGALVVLVFGGGLLRNVLKRRRAKLATPEIPTADE